MERDVLAERGVRMARDLIGADEVDGLAGLRIMAGMDRAVRAEIKKAYGLLFRSDLPLGKALEAAVSRYNQFVGSLETQVLTQARRFEDLKVEHQGKAVEPLEPLESAVRPLAKLPTTETPPVRLVAGDEASPRP